MVKPGRRLFVHSFLGKRYRIHETSRRARDFKGICDNPSEAHKTMQIPLGRAPLYLDVQLHEALHACFYLIDEETINRTSIDITRYLWKLGWRNVSVPKEEGGDL